MGTSAGKSFQIQAKYMNGKAIISNSGNSFLIFFV